VAEAERTLQWQDKAVLGLGVLVFLSPWLFGFSSLPAAAWNAWIVGAYIAFWAAIGIVARAYWPHFFIAFGCVWLVLSQEILGFSDHTVAMVTVMASGAVTGFIAMWGAVAQANRDNA
jgi:hypothetical protein